MFKVCPEVGQVLYSSQQLCVVSVDVLVTLLLIIKLDELGNRFSSFKQYGGYV